MEFQEFVKLIKQKKETILIVVFLFVLAAVALTFIQPFRYVSESKVLVVQDSPGGSDPYQISKSNEHVAGLLTKIMVTNSFYREVLDSGFSINKNYFSLTEIEQMKLWRKTVKASSDNNGIITIRVYHDDRVQVSQISQAINFVLRTKHENYHGFGEVVDVKVIENPFTSDRPVKPNIFINVGAALFFGFLLSLSYIYLFPSSDYDLKFVPRKNDSDEDAFDSKSDEFEIREKIKQEEPFSERVFPGRVEEPEKKTESDFDKLRKAMRQAPPDLPVVDTEEIGEEELKNARQPEEIKRKGNIQNVMRKID